MMTLLAWEASSTLVPASGATVPVEIVAVAPESNVRALAEDVPDAEEALPEAADETTPQPQEEEAAPSPTAPPQRQRPQQDEFDLASIARMVNREDQARPRRNEGQTADRNQQGAGRGTADAVALEDRVRALARAHLRRCWRMPIDLPEPERLIVTLEFRLNRNGTLAGQPVVTSPRNYTFDPAMRTAVEAAVRAVRMCDPYPFADDPVVGDHYEIWRETEFTFRPGL